MSIYLPDFRDYVVTPIVRATGLPSPVEATSLLMKIAAWESSGCTYLDQLDKARRDGPAYGPFQFEKGGAYAEVHRVIDRRAGFAGLEPARNAWPLYRTRSIDELRCRLDSAVFYARVALYPHPRPLPAPNAWQASFDYYLDVWKPGRAPTLVQFRGAFENWRRG